MLHISLRSRLNLCQWKRIFQVFSHKIL